MEHAARGGVASGEARPRRRRCGGWTARASRFGRPDLTNDGGHQIVPYPGEYRIFDLTKTSCLILWLHFAYCLYLLRMRGRSWGRNKPSGPARGKQIWQYIICIFFKYNVWRVSNWYQSIRL
uniref:Uncharacterized protein n=1 Tax=Oryza punctata TaxID=4537 RepID=A0A0E0L7R0_ORYPU